MKDSLGLLEKDIDEEAFLVSKTDLKGDITYCNQTFFRSSKFKKQRSNRKTS